MTPRVRKFVLTTHVVFSVGWLGAIAPYLALAVAGLTSRDAQMMRAYYLSMEVIGWFVILPFSLGALLSGLVQSLGTQWGLFRRWWILMKFVLTIVAVVVLLRHMQEVSSVSRMLKGGTMSAADFRPELIHAAGGLLVVLAAMMLSVIKPWGMTPYGVRQGPQLDLPPRPGDIEVPREPLSPAGRPRGALILRIVGLHAVGIALLVVVILHFTGGGLRHH